MSKKISLMVLLSGLSQRHYGGVQSCDDAKAFFEAISQYFQKRNNQHNNSTSSNSLNLQNKSFK